METEATGLKLRRIAIRPCQGFGCLKEGNSKGHSIFTYPTTRHTSKNSQEISFRLSNSLHNNEAPSADSPVGKPVFSFKINMTKSTESIMDQEMTIFKEFFELFCFYLRDQERESGTSKLKFTLFLEKFYPHNLRCHLD